MVEWQLLLGLAAIVLMVWAVVRQVDVRLALMVAALVLGGVAGDPMAIVRKFLTTLSSEQYVIPLCTAMGFARVLQHTECDQHLIQLLIRPLRHVRILLIPGAVLVGFLVNMPVISQTSTAVAVGTVLVPVLLAARVSPATTGAALLLGASLGGELLNPGAPELRTIAAALNVKTHLCVDRVKPLLFIHLTVATLVFWAWSIWFERRREPSPELSEDSGTTGDPFRVNLLKAAVPLVPLALLFLCFPDRGVFHVPETWLTDPNKPGDRGNFDSRLIGAAMLTGVAAAALTSFRSVPGLAKPFFEGAGYALTNIVALIVTAACFGEGVKQIGLASLIGRMIAEQPILLLSAAGVLPLAFAVLSGSGMASTQSLFELFIQPATDLRIDPIHVGAVVALGAAAGRTMSPVAAVTLMCSQLTHTSPFTLAKRVAGPLLAGMVAVIIAAIIIAE